jgi:hypothetical protein
MSTSLFEIPSELLIAILTFLPNKSLLKFSQCSRYAHSLANSSLHTLNLVIQPPPYRRDSFVPTHRTTPNELLAHILSSSPKRLMARQAHLGQVNLHKKDGEASIDKKDPYQTVIRVEDAHTYEHGTLVNFHSALLSSILTRHQNALRNVDISVWAFTTPIAKTVSQLYALRSLSIRIEDSFYARIAHRSRAGEQQTAWEVLAASTASGSRLRVLKLENADLTEIQLFKLLSNNTHCRELQFITCASIGKALWDYLGRNWEGRAALQSLAVGGCGGFLDQVGLKAIEELKGLQVRYLTCLNRSVTDCVQQHLDLYRCVGLNGEIVSD